MSTDDERLVNLDELGSVLESYEGPSRPRRKPSERTRSRPFGVRAGSVAAVTGLLVGSGLGFGIASSIAPSGEAARSPVGLGFVPDSGWSVVQSGADATSAQPAYAIASNVPLDPGDTRGRPTASGLPYATLLELPPNGVVILATFTVPRVRPMPGERFPARMLPLRLRDATPYILNAAQLRPDRPLGEYQLRARINGRDVDLQFYFGTRRPPKAMISAAQRQLDRLVVERPERAEQVERRALPLQPTASPRPVTPPSKVADRTFTCTPGVDGVPIINVSAQSGYRKGERFEWLAQLTVTTPGGLLPRQKDYLPTLAGATAGWPPPARISSGGIGADLQRCKLTRASVPFTRRGLTGGVASQFGDEYRCYPPTTVLIRFRAVFHSATALKRDLERRWLGAIARIDKAQVAVATPKGKPLAYGEVFDSGKASLFVAPSC